MTDSLVASALLSSERGDKVRKMEMAVEEAEDMTFTWEMDFFAEDLRRTIDFARLRCMPREQVLQRVLDVDSEEMDAYVYRLRELALTTAEFEFLTEAMTCVANRTVTAAPDVRSKVDKLLLALVRLLPSELAMRFAEPYLEHARKTRRRWAYAAFRGKVLSAEAAAKLARVFKKTGDKAALPFVIAAPESLRLLGPEFLLEELAGKDQHYWRGRVLQTLLSYDRTAAIALSQSYPMEFVHAAGRTEDKSLVPAIRSLFEANAQNPKFLGMYTWALGKLKASEELDRLEQLFRSKGLLKDGARQTAGGR